MSQESMRVVGWGQTWKEVEKDANRNLPDRGLICACMRGERMVCMWKRAHAMVHVWWSGDTVRTGSLFLPYWALFLFLLQCYLFWLVGLPNHLDSSVSASHLTLGALSLWLGTTRASLFYMGSGDQAQVIMFVWQALLPSEPSHWPSRRFSEGDTS